MNTVYYIKDCYLSHILLQFIDRIIALRRAVFDPHMLKNLICVSTWQTSGSRSGQWKLFIKFRKMDPHTDTGLEKKKVGD